jgi:hypothetical protein
LFVQLRVQALGEAAAGDDKLTFSTIFQRIRNYFLGFNSCVMNEASGVDDDKIGFTHRASLLVAS